LNYQIEYQIYNFILFQVFNQILGYLFKRGGKRDQKYSYNPDYNLQFNTTHQNDEYLKSYYHYNPNILQEQTCRPNQTTCGSLDNIYVHTRTQFKITTCVDDDGIKIEKKPKRGFCAPRKNRRSNSQKQPNYMY
jgi:hypothetical protein